MAEGRDAKGRFGHGNPGGPGRAPRSTPLHREITPEKAQHLWAERHKVATEDPDAERRDRAAEYILKYHTGAPAQQQPDVPAVPWGKIRTLEDIRRAVDTVFGLHESEEVDATGLDFLLRVLERAAKLFETLDLAPQVRQLQEQLAEIKATAMTPA